jgi:O-antigen/teichoic acid export membrane protein
VLRVRPRLTAGLSWVRDERKLTGYLLGEYVFGLGASQLAILLVGVLASPSAVGSLRAAQVLLGPLGVIGAAAFQFAVPEIARRPELSPRRRTLFGLGVSGGLGLITLVYGICLLAMPDRVGLALFGDSWRGAAAVLLAMSVSSLASSLANGPAGVLYGMGQARATFRLNLAKGPLLLVVVLFTTWQWGAVGAAWGLAFVEAAVLPAWWLTLRDALRRRPSADRQLLPQAAQ